MTVDTDQLSESTPEGMTRREVLTYAWLASLALLTLEIGVVIYQFAMPRLAAGEFGGPVDLGPAEALPGVGAPPQGYPRAMLWWVVTPAGALALYKVCTHLGCIYDWRSGDDRFVCPCHGAEFERDGAYVTGPAPRGLDRFVIRALDASGQEVARTDPSGAPLPVPPGSRIIVETGDLISGPPKA